MIITDRGLAQEIDRQIARGRRLSISADFRGYSPREPIYTIEIFSRDCAGRYSLESPHPGETQRLMTECIQRLSSDIDKEEGYGRGYDRGPFGGPQREPFAYGHAADARAYANAEELALSRLARQATKSRLAEVAVKAKVEKAVKSALGDALAVPSPAQMQIDAGPDRLSLSPPKENA